jgi:hypothetical protein
MLDMSEYFPLLDEHNIDSIDAFLDCADSFLLRTIGMRKVHMIKLRRFITNAPSERQSSIGRSPERSETPFWLAHHGSLERAAESQTAFGSIFGSYDSTHRATSSE